MKSVLRNHAVGFTALAAIALSACSGAEDTEMNTTSSDSLAGNVERADSPVSTDATAKSEPAATEATPDQEQQQPTARAERHRSSSSGTETPASSATSPAPTSEGEPAAEDTSEDAPAEQPEATPASVHSNTMHVSGRQLLDSCGQPFVVRGVEQILGNQLPEGNDWMGLVREIASTGVNAVRILPGVNTLSLDDIDQILSFIGEQNMVAFLAPLGQGNDWYAQDDVKAMLKKHESFIIIDAYGEPQYDDVERWRAEAKAALAEFRTLGYDVPLTVTANQFGRALPSLFDYGAEILGADPLHNTFLGWQAYWGGSGYYQDLYGYSFDEAVDAIVSSGLPIQLGLDHITDLPSTEADYGTLMRGAEENGIGWLWWDFYNPYGAENNLSQDGTAENLTATGSIVLESHAASIANTAQRTCGL